MVGHRNHQDGLWDIPLGKHPTSQPPPCTPKHTANVITTKDKTTSDLITYLHACCFSPPTSTFIKAIKNGNFQSWPGLTANNVKKHLYPSLATAKGHLNQERANLQSSKSTTPQQEDYDDHDCFPSTEPTRTSDVLATIVPFKERNTAYSDLTGRFPHKSSRGNEYILVVYDYDSNAILTTPLQSRAAATIRKGWEHLNETLTKSGRKPNLYILDNECSAELKHTMNKNKISFQRVPPHIHRRNAAERTIQTFKNHFLAGLATADPD